MKIKILYTPEDGPEVNWEIDPETLLSVEAEMLESHGGTTWQSYAEYWALVERGNIRSWRALLWLLLNRSNPKLRFEDVVFRVNEFGVAVVDEDEPAGKDAADGDSISSPSAQLDSPADSVNSTSGP